MRHLAAQERVYRPITKKRRDFKLTSRRYRRGKPLPVQAPAEPLF